VKAFAYAGIGHSTNGNGENIIDLESMTYAGVDVG
jgi:hypothetical protein